MAGMRANLRALVAGMLLGGGLGAVIFGCLTPQERRAVTVADCVAQMALGLPDVPLPEDPGELTREGFWLAQRVVGGVRTCRHAEPELVTAWPGDGGL
jgi:hypothetical protein